MEKNHILLDDSSFPVNQNNEYEPELLARAATSLIDSSLRSSECKEREDAYMALGSNVMAAPYLMRS
ncbi:uncharacterized protein N7469_005504 [Penicillium citrinum]|uniref:Uncharacterized protein n=1 Tax=Penicillium citrinum TaxID=5077 RepID=A0A9W9TPP9_PENCI|nr:uncharacterized protein N7469_005504 [Penicillium citrinum]KAJ5233738.1 hypothetical protein N7469_005504 [Penicillium citrinum]